MKRTSAQAAVQFRRQPWWHRLIVLSWIAACFLFAPPVASAQQGGLGGVHSYNLLSTYLDGGATIGRGSIANLGDVDGDGVIDFVADHSVSSTQVSICFLDASGRVSHFQDVGFGAGGFGGFISVADDFGASVEGIGDLDGDGVPDMAVGAVDDFVAGIKTGSVWVILLNNDGTVKSEQQISSNQGGFGGVLQSGDLFGSGLAALGDLNGDGIRDLAVGASGSRGGSGAQGKQWGAVWILFMNPDGTVLSEQRIDANNGGFSGELGSSFGFGQSMSHLDDFDGDGVPDIAVSAPGWKDTSGLTYGAFWLLFLKSDGTVKSDLEISIESGGFTGILDDNDGFADQLALLGDVDHDGVDDIAVGALQDADGATDELPERGAVWILALNPDGIVKSNSKISATSGNFDGDFETFLGESMTSLGDFDSDGVPDLLASSTVIDDQGFVKPGQWMLFLDDGLVSASFIYGSGVNPQGSLSVVSGRPSIGTTMTLGLDNPSGTQMAGANPFIILSIAPDPNFPSGTLIPGFGMIAPGASGELLIRTLAGDLIPPALTGAPWQGPGQPASIDVDVPSDVSLIGLSVYGQGLLIDPTATGNGVKFGLTDAVELRIGA